MSKRKKNIEKELEGLTRDAERFLSKKPKHVEESNYNYLTKIVASYVTSIQVLHDTLTTYSDHSYDDVDYTIYKEYDDIAKIIPQLTIVLNQTKELIYKAEYIDYTTEYLDSKVEYINNLLSELHIETITLDEIDEESEDENDEESTTCTSTEDSTTSSIVSADEGTSLTTGSDAGAAEERSSDVIKQDYKNLKTQILNYPKTLHTTDEDILFYKGIIAELEEFQHDEELAPSVLRSLTTSYYKLGKLLHQEEYYDESSRAFAEALKLAEPTTASDIIDKLVLNYPELKIVEDDTASSMVSADDVTDVSTSTNATDVMGDSFHDDITE